MSDNWKGSESELFAEFVEHREAFMIMRKWWRPGYRIAFTYVAPEVPQGSAAFEVTINKLRAPDVSTWAAHGAGETLDAAAKAAAEQAAFRA